MMNGKTFSKFVSGSALALALLATPVLAGAQSVHTDYDHDANFTQFHTFSFAKVQTSDPLYQKRIQDDIAADLQKAGLQQVPSNGDLAVTAIGGVTDQQEYNTFYTGLGPGFGWRGWGGWGGGGWGGSGVTDTTVQNIPVGTLMIDLYNTQTHNLVFRGSSQADMHKSSEKNIKLVQKTVDKIFDRYPARHA